MGVGRPDSEGSLGRLLQEGDILGEIQMVGVGILGYKSVGRMFQTEGTRCVAS